MTINIALINYLCYLDFSKQRLELLDWKIQIAVNSTAH